MIDTVMFAVMVVQGMLQPPIIGTRFPKGCRPHANLTKLSCHCVPWDISFTNKINPFCSALAQTCMCASLSHLFCGLPCLFSTNLKYHWPCMYACLQTWTASFECSWQLALLNWYWNLYIKPLKKQTNIEEKSHQQFNQPAIWIYQSRGHSNNLVQAYIFTSVSYPVLFDGKVDRLMMTSNLFFFRIFNDFFKTSVKTSMY